MDSMKRGKKLPPVPKFQNELEQKNNNNSKLEQKVNSFLTQIQQTYHHEENDIQPKSKKNIKLANINLKLNNLLNSKKINLNTIQTTKEIGKEQNIIVPEIQKRNQLEIEYDPNLPNNYEVGLVHYENILASLSSSNVKPNINENLHQEIQEITQPQNDEKEDLLQEKQTLALRMMQKYGFKVGQGLGKQSQGIRTPLTVKKTTDSSCIIEPSVIQLNSLIAPITSARNALSAFEIELSRVIIFMNLVGVQQLNGEVEKQIKEQCQIYGTVLSLVAYMMGSQIRVFVQMENSTQALKVFAQINNKFYKQNPVSIRFYSEHDFEQGILNSSIHQHIVT